MGKMYKKVSEYAYCLELTQISKCKVSFKRTICKITKNCSVLNLFEKLFVFGWLTGPNVNCEA